MAGSNTMQTLTETLQALDFLHIYIYFFFINFINNNRLAFVSCVLCRVVCGEEAGLGSGEAEESGCTVICGTAGGVTHVFCTHVIYEEQWAHAACF